MTKEAPGFFDVDERLAELSAKGDDLERLNALVDFELFRPALEAAVPRGDRSKGGRPPFDHVFMFKILILQAMHALSDERCKCSSGSASPTRSPTPMNICAAWARRRWAHRRSPAHRQKARLAHRHVETREQSVDRVRFLQRLASYWRRGPRRRGRVRGTFAALVGERMHGLQD